MTYKKALEPSSPSKSKNSLDRPMTKKQNSYSFAFTVFWMIIRFLFFALNSMNVLQVKKRLVHAAAKKVHLFEAYCA